MTKQQIMYYIEGKKIEKEKYFALWNHIVELNDSVGLKKETMNEIQAKISSKMAQCDRSIEDHEKLL